MKRKLLVCALSSFSAVAFADVTLYGRVAVGLENDDFQNTSVPGTGSIQDFGSYFGLRGSDPVYGQTSAIWQVEQYLDLTAGQAYYSSTAGGMTVYQIPNGNYQAGRITSETNTLANGETYLGLQGAWGRIRLGNLSNYIRSSQGAVDVFNYGNGADGLGTYSRFAKLLPTSMRYDSPTWNGFNFAAIYSYQTSGQLGVSGIGSTTNFGGGLNGYYSGGVISAGLGWSSGYFGVNLGGMLWQQVGTYATGTSSMSLPAGYPSQAAYSNAYSERLELSYNNPDNLIAGLGIQSSSGLGWSSWANSGGSFGNYYTSSSAFNYTGLAANQYQTQEIAASIGWHIGPWTPKIGYAWGNNLMYNSNVGQVLMGTGSQIPNSGYQQAVVELDWNITPRTIAFVNFGQVWWGSTLQNTVYCGNTNCGSSGGTVDGSTQSALNQSSMAVGFSHTF